MTDRKIHPVEFVAELVWQIIKKYQETELEIKPKHSFTLEDLCREIAVEVDEYYLSEKKKRIQSVIDSMPSDEDLIEDSKI